MFSNSCLLRHFTKNIVFLVYVDDVFINVKFLEQVSWFKVEFDKIFKVKNLREIKKILNIKIIKDRKNRLLRMNQTHYFKKILNDLKMKTERHKFIEISMNDYDAIKFFFFIDERINVKDYQHVIDKIMYVAIHTRLDIAFAVERLNQFFNDSSKQHDEDLKHLFRYIRFIIDLELMLKNSENFKIVEYSNSNYANDKSNRISIFDYVYMLENESIVWRSRKQKFVVNSITEVEYMILSFCVKENLWLIQMLKNMKLKKYLKSSVNVINIAENQRHETKFSIQLKSDNQTTNNLMKNAHVHERFKHIDVVYHHIRDLTKKNIVQLNYIFNAEMIANDMTKLLLKKRFKIFVKQLKMQKWKNSESITLTQIKNNENLK